MNASERLLRDLLERGDYLERLSLDEARKIVAIMDKAHEEVLGKIVATRGAGTRAWLVRVKKAIDSIYRAASARVASETLGDLKGLAEEEASWVATRFERVTVGLDTATPAPTQLWAAITALPAVGGSTLGQLLEALGETANAEVTEALQSGIVQGETNDQIIRRLRGRVVRRASWRNVDGKRTYVPGRYEGGVMTEGTTRRAAVLARTATMHVANQAREAYFEANADLIEGYQRVETLDGDTCLICGADDGHVYKPGESRPALPAHANCRGTYVPVMKSWRDLGIDRDEVPPGTRASMDGQVPENQTYVDRLRKMSPAKQDALIGPSRGRLFREGVPLDAMVEEGRIIPLKDLAERLKGDRP